VKGSGYTEAVDWWALGVLIYEMLCGASPFAAEDQMATFRAIVRGSITFPDTMTDVQARDLIRRLLAREVVDRLGCRRDGDRETFAHPWFAGFDFEGLLAKRLPAPWVPELTSDDDTQHFEAYDEEEDEEQEGEEGGGDGEEDGGDDGDEEVAPGSPLAAQPVEESEVDGEDDEAGGGDATDGNAGDDEENDEDDVDEDEQYDTFAVPAGVPAGPGRFSAAVSSGAAMGGHRRGDSTSAVDGDAEGGGTGSSSLSPVRGAIGGAAATGSPAMRGPESDGDDGSASAGTGDGDHNASSYSLGAALRAAREKRDGDAASAPVPADGVPAHDPLWFDGF
jgi:hypothetical protein